MQRTDDIIGAWAEAYGVIADIFIQVEEELYQKLRTMVVGVYLNH